MRLVVVYFFIYLTFFCVVADIKDSRPDQNISKTGTWAILTFAVFTFTPGGNQFDGPHKSCLWIM